MYRFFLAVIFIINFSCGPLADEQATPSSSPSAEVTESKEGLAAETLATAPSYQKADVNIACIFSQLTYCSRPDSLLNEYLPGWRITWYPKAVGGNHAFVATDGYSYVVAIRGSLMDISWDALDNWIYQDLNIAEQVNWQYATDKSARVAAGAYRGWKNLEQLTDTTTGEKLAAYLLKKTSAVTPVVFTGHSLGGNLATVYLSYFAHQLQKAGRAGDLQLITLAAPTPGNEAFANEMAVRFPSTCRIENELDIVPKFPCTDKVAGLGNIFKTPSAANIMVGYRQVTVPLSSVFKTMSAGMRLLELKNGLSSFAPIEGKNNKMLPGSLSGNNKKNTVADWFAEAGYQHSIRQYAQLLQVPVIECTP